MSPASPKIADSELQAWVDDRLEADDSERVAAAIAADPALRAQAEHLRQQNQALRALFAPELDAPIPARLTAAARGAGRESTSAGADAARKVGSAAPPANRPWFRQLASLATAVMFGIAIGWIARDTAPGASDPGVPAGASAPSTADRQFAGAEAVTGITRAATVAYAAYAPEVRHPVEVGAGEQAHLVAWLSKRLGTQLKVPSLEANGFGLVGGRLLPDDSGGVAAQFMFENAGGQRLTLFVRRDSAGSDTAFRYAEHAGVGTFYWLDRGFGYALSGELTRESMLSVATVVYRQLNP